MLNDGIVKEDSYNIFVPIEDHDLMKSVELDANGDYIVQGVMTAEDKDEEDDSITPEGMDCSYFLEKGWIKYEHGNSPNQFIGEPIEVKVGQFEHPTLHKSVNGIFVKGRLFAKRELAKQAIQALQDLQKSHTKRTMGWSIEGNVKERDRTTGKIVKSILRNVVLTMNPVNTMTFAELAKSFAHNHELTIDMGVNKSMDMSAVSAITPQSIEGYKPIEEKDDEQAKQIEIIRNIFKEFLKENVLDKSLRNKFVTSNASVVGMIAYQYALQYKLDNEEAFKFASYISSNQEVLKSIFRTNFGGERMSKTLSELLDVDLEELQKSLDNENEEDEESEEDKKKKKDSEDKKDSKEKDSKEEDSEDKEDSEEEDSEDKEDSEEEDSEDDSEDEEDDDKKPFTKKSIQTDFAKSLAGNEENKQAFEVSDFLSNLVDEVGYSMDGFAKSMNLNVKNQNAIVKALVSVGDLVKSLTEKVDDLQSENGELKKSLNEVLNAPVGRRSAVSARELATITKSAESKGTLNKAQVSDILMKSFEAGEIPGITVSRYEAGVTLGGLQLPQIVKTKLGL